MIDEYQVISFYDNAEAQAEALAEFYKTEAYPCIDRGEIVSYDVYMTDEMRKDFENDESTSIALKKISDATGVIIHSRNFEITYC